MHLLPLILVLKEYLFIKNLILPASFFIIIITVLVAELLAQFYSRKKISSFICLQFATGKSLGRVVGILLYLSLINDGDDVDDGSAFHFSECLVSDSLGSNFVGNLGS